MTENKLSEKALADVANLHSAYKPEELKLKALVYGKAKTGKTRLALTCPTPILIDSFDPDGTSVGELQPLIKSGDILVDNRWEKEDDQKPFAFREWCRVFEERRRSGLFDHIGTYMLDSTTTWAQTILNDLSGAGAVQLQHYQMQQRAAVRYCQLFMTLPCHVILTGHEDLDKDEVSGRMTSGLLVPGKLSRKMLLVFSNIFYSMIEFKRDERSYYLRTAGDQLYTAGSRPAGAKLADKEPPDIRAILKKAGLDSADKPPLTKGGE